MSDEPKIDKEELEEISLLLNLLAQQVNVMPKATWIAQACNIRLKEIEEDYVSRRDEWEKSEADKRTQPLPAPTNPRIFPAGSGVVTTER